MSKRYAEHEVHGRVEILAGPEKCNEDGTVYWVKCHNGRTEEVTASTLTFSPFKEYWLLHRDNPQPPAFYRLEDAALAELSENKWASHITHHFQQEEGGRWDCKTAHWKGKADE